MKKMKPNKYNLLFILIFFLLQYDTGLAQEDSAVAQPVVKLHYFNNNNSVQYLILESMMKKGKTLTPRKNMVYQLYMDSSSAKNLLANLQTDAYGKAKAFIPPVHKVTWNAVPQHTFIVKAGDEEVLSDYTITKTKITVDTSTTDGVRNIIASVMKWHDNDWVPAVEVEMKIGIERLGGSILSGGDEETYTTDSSGSITVELKKNNMPGDAKGNYVLAARVEDNDQFGNLLVQKTVPWGIIIKTNNNFFNERTLWSTRFKTPYWLLLIVYSIVTGVWGTLIYLVFQLIKIKKIGT